MILSLLSPHPHSLANILLQYPSTLAPYRIWWAVWVIVERPTFCCKNDENSRTKTSDNNNNNMTWQQWFSILYSKCRIPRGQQWFRLFFRRRWATTFNLSTASGRTVDCASAATFDAGFYCWSIELTGVSTPPQVDFSNNFRHGHCNFGCCRLIVFKVSLGSFSGGHYHFCFWTNVVPPQPLQLQCLQWMHAVAAWQYGRSLRHPQPHQKCNHRYATPPAFFGVVTARRKVFF